MVELCLKIEPGKRKEARPVRKITLLGGIPTISVFIEQKTGRREQAYNNAGPIHPVQACGNRGASSGTCIYGYLSNLLS